VLIRINMKWNK